MTNNNKVDIYIINFSKCDFDRCQLESKLSDFFNKSHMKKKLQSVKKFANDFDIKYKEFQELLNDLRDGYLIFKELYDEIDKFEENFIKSLNLDYDFILEIKWN